MSTWIVSTWTTSTLVTSLPGALAPTAIYYGLTQTIIISATQTSTTITSTSLTLTSLGPLTTYWTPPTTCLSTITFNGEGWLGVGMTSGLVDLDCYPPSFATDAVYSPGVCPRGWTSGCSPSLTSISFGSTVTAIQCCPSSLTCSSAWCLSQISAASISVFGFQVPKATASAGGVLSGSWLFASFQNQTVSAEPIFVAYGPTDSEILKLLTATQPPSPIPSGNNTTSSSDNSLPLGAKIAIGVIIPVVAIALIVAIAAYCFRIRRRQKTEIPQQVPVMEVDRSNFFGGPARD